MSVLAALALAAALASAAPVDGGETGSPGGAATAAAAAEAERQDAPWFALPVLFWLPETRLGVGATGGVHFHVADAERASSVFAAAVYTLQEQGSVDVAGEVHTPAGLALTGRARALHFPDVLYGIGPDSREADRERFTRRTVEAYVVGELPLFSGPVRVGPRLDLRLEEIRGVEPGGLLAGGGVTGADGFQGVGLGASLTVDTRDGAFWPSRGVFVQAWHVFYPGGGDRPAAGRGLAEARRFVGLGRGTVLGVAGIAEWATGEPPFTLLPRLGSTRFLRGYREGRFRDRLAWSTQAELRVPLAGPLSGTTFAALGDVAPSLGALRARTVKAAAGVGLRWRLTAEGANIRLDLAASPSGMELYVLVLEAF
jgi:hypothetical protein